MEREDEEGKCTERDRDGKGGREKGSSVRGARLLCAYGVVYLRVRRAVSEPKSLGSWVRLLLPSRSVSSLASPAIGGSDVNAL